MDTPIITKEVVVIVEYLSIDVNVESVVVSRALMIWSELDR